MMGVNTVGRTVGGGTCVNDRAIATSSGINISIASSPILLSRWFQSLMIWEYSLNYN